MRGPDFCQFPPPGVARRCENNKAVQRNYSRSRSRSVRHSSYPERPAVLNPEPLELRRLKADLRMYHKILNTVCSINFDDHFTKRTFSSISTRPRSSGRCVLKPFCRTNRIANNFFFRSINTWNKCLPVTKINVLRSLSLKRRLSDYDLSHLLLYQFNN